jgi:hypothetical protein
VEPDRIRTAEDAALGFFARRTGVAFFFAADLFTAVFSLFPFISLAAILFHVPLNTLNSRPIQCPAAAFTPEYAGDGLRILSAIDHNDQRLTLHIGKTSPDDANGTDRTGTRGSRGRTA